MRASQPGRLARYPSAAGHRPACVRRAPHHYSYIDEWVLRCCEIQSRCYRETHQHVAKGRTATVAGFASSLSQYLSLRVLCSEMPSDERARSLSSVGYVSRREPYVIRT